MSIFTNITEKSKIKAKIKRYIIRRILRGSFKLKNYKINILVAFREEICKKKFIQIENKSSKILFGDLYNNREIILRHLVIKVITTNISSWFFLFCIGSKIRIFYPLPLHWLKEAKKHGLNFNFSISLLLWYLLCFYLFFKSLIKILKEIINFFKNKIIFKEKNLGNYVYFFDLSHESQILQTNSKINDNKYSNIVNWFVHNSDNNNYDSIFHSFDPNINQKLDNNKKLKYIDSAIPTILSYKNFFLFLSWSIISSLIVFFDLLRGRWWHAVCYDEIIKSKLVELDNGKNIAQEYLFNNSNMRCRPGWTYIAEKLGSKITFYFNSLNNDKIRKKNSTLDEFYWGLREMTWPRYLTWNESHVKLLRRLVGEKPDIINVGYIPFSSSNLLIDNHQLFKKKYIIIFPVQPLRKIYYNSSVLPIIEVDYVNTINGKKFLIDIVEAAKNINVNLIIKQKRKVGPLVDPGYNNLLLELKKLNNVTFVDEYISAEYLFDNSIGVISFPFTSTGYISSLKKQNIFYDPTETLSISDPKMHDVKCINSYNDLKTWMVDNFSEKIKNI